MSRTRILLTAVATTVLLTACGSGAAEEGAARSSGAAESTSNAAADSAAGSASNPATGGAAGSANPEAPAVAPKIQAPAQSYVDAVNAGDLDALVAAFAPDAEIIDVSRSIKGHDAIRTWAGNEVVGGRLRVLGADEMPGGQDLLVHWAPEGSNGWEARYRFTMSGTEITRTDLQYA